MLPNSIRWRFAPNPIVWVTRITSSGWLLGLYILAISKVILGWVFTCDSVHSWQLYSAVPLGDQVASTWPNTILSHYPDTEPTSPCPILIMPSAWLGSDKYQFLSHWSDSTSIWNPWSPKIGEGRSTPLAIPSGTTFSEIIWKDVKPSPIMRADDRLSVLFYECSWVLSIDAMLGSVLRSAALCGHAPSAAVNIEISSILGQYPRKQSQCVLTQRH